jgi:hypothetical protein
MSRRALPLALVSVLLIGIGPREVRSGGQESGPFAMPDGELVPSLEQRCLEALRTPGQSPDWYVGWIQQLGRCGESPAAVAELIRWLEYIPLRFRLHLRPNSATRFPDHPAQKALIHMGPVAAPQLVDEYVYFFENTNVRAWDDRWGILSEDRNGKFNEIQDPSYRLGSIVVILSSDQDFTSRNREMARKAVEHALQRMEAEPQDDRVQRACRELIDRIVSQFPEDEWAKLFPAAAFAK